MTERFSTRFKELTERAEHIEQGKRIQRGAMEGTFVDGDELLRWNVNALHLLSNVCGDQSEHYKHFTEAKRATIGTTNYTIFCRMRAVFLAAKDDFESGQLNSLRNIVEAEVFESELEQAQSLLGAGYISAAAVVAGVVLETTLRRMCIDRNLGVEKLDRMNADLAKAGAYNKLVQKQVTTWAHIRNSAAHGHPEEFTKEQVNSMIADVGKFVADVLS